MKFLRMLTCALSLSLVTCLLLGCDNRGPHERELDDAKAKVLNDPNAPQSARAMAESMTEAARPLARQLDENERRYPETAKYLRGR